MINNKTNETNTLLQIESLFKKICFHNTKKSRLFNYNLSLSLRNKTVYNELQVFT